MTPVPATPEWLVRTRVLIVVGKGGVGTSTVAAASALLAAQGGADVLLVSVDGKPGLGPLLGGSPLTSDEQLLRAIDRGGGRIRGRTISPQLAFRDYLELKGRPDRGRCPASGQRDAVPAVGIGAAGGGGERPHPHPGRRGDGDAR